MSSKQPTRSTPGPNQPKQNEQVNQPKQNEQVKRLALQLASIKRTWKGHGATFTTWWSEQDKDARLAFLLEWCPYMPLARDKPYTIVDGKKEDLRGSALIMPELNQAEMVQGTGLIDLITQLIDVPEPGEPGAAEGYAAVEELCLRHLAITYSMVPHVNTQLSPQEVAAGIVLLLPGKNFGDTVIVKKMVPTIKEWLQEQMAVTSLHWEACMMRLENLLLSVATCLDHYRLEVLGRATYSTLGASQGCARCGALERSDGQNRAMPACSACGIVFYCGSECQKAHWKDHKPYCKPKDAISTGNKDYIMLRVQRADVASSSKAGNTSSTQSQDASNTKAGEASSSKPQGASSSKPQDASSSKAGDASTSKPQAGTADLAPSDTRRRGWFW